MASASVSKNVSETKKKGKKMQKDEENGLKFNWSSLQLC